MKRILTITLFFSFAFSLFTLNAQSPDLLSYQAVIRDASGNLIKDRQVDMKISILQGSADGNVVFIEEHLAVTNKNGLVSIVIGSGQPAYAGTELKSSNPDDNAIILSGDFSAIDWANGPYFIKVETDPDGGTNYSITGTSQLLSVPYAKYADKAKELSGGIPAPLYVEGSTMSGDSAIIKGMNNGNGYGVYGVSYNNYGVMGYSVSVPGVFGYSGAYAGVEGFNGNTGNTGALGDTIAGVYGKGVVDNSYGVKGEYAKNGNFGVLGASYSGIVGVGKGNANGVYGSNENGNYGYLGGGLYSVYAATDDDNLWAGYFVGKTTVSGGKLELRNSTGENWMTCLRGNNQNSGISWIEHDSDGSDVTQWLFPYFRGWQSNNLIVRDEAAKRDVMTFEYSTGRVGIGTSSPEGVVHVSSGTSGDATLIVEADIDNNNEDDQPFLLFKQDGGLVTGGIGFTDGSNNLRIKASEKIEVIVTDSYGKDKLIATIDENGIVQPDKIKYLSIPSHSFVSRYSGVEYGGTADAIWVTSSLGNAELIASVQLPDGARITGLTCWWSDYSSGTGDLFLKKYSFDSGDGTLLAELHSSGDSGARVSASANINNEVINNQNNFYTLYLKMPKEDAPGFFFYGARIKYIVN
jgi:hypothetical protein